METHPWPLQLFMPLQLFFADLHSEVPLQELTPEQCTVAVSAATEMPVSPDVKNIAAAAAIAAFDNLVICMMIPSFIQAQRYCCSCTKTAPVSILLLLPAFYYLCRPLILPFASDRAAVTYYPTGMTSSWRASTCLARLP